MREELDYLNCYWNPKIGHHCINSGVISYMDGEFPEQVMLGETDKIYYIQDLEWNPSKEDCIELLTTLGFAVHAETVSYGNIHFLKPNELKDFVDLLSQLVIIRQMTPNKPSSLISPN